MQIAWTKILAEGKGEIARSGLGESRSVKIASYGPIGFRNRSVQTPMLGGVGAGGERPPATRFNSFG